ncbi:concanavalin A-like lectin/glucanase [Guyanagaster necrorhizus]|uniref:Concanavalin A-like lectin/glucanase n=1 Tax=Guyanagaster necrorhizus TaxID=856835 RepID=A0A9P7VN72_9AGAR|nr:concanavalin A-like lectin/glucanase [Guyanagaster necrorhizus MCA 3950]KAG7444283.1 concanavalin A-like lectin/glucanase [Guyanagaster necrorhizus MCA 3950]
MSAEDLPPPRPSFIASERRSQMSMDSGSESDAPVTMQGRRSRHRRSEDRQLDWNPAILYADMPSTPNSASPLNKRAPPSSFMFPFQHHAGNPDPGMPIPGVSRRSSFDSSHNHSQQNHSQQLVYETTRVSPGLDSPTLNREIPRVSSNATFRAPFLSPASRPGSSLWSPPSYPYLNQGGPDSPAASSTALASGLARSKPPGPSTKIAAKFTVDDKPWLKERDGKARASWWITFVLIILGVAAAALLCWSGISTIDMLKDSDLCLVMDEDWSNGISDDNWSRDVMLGGFGNGEFQVATSSDKNAYINNGQLYIMPTLTSDDIGTDSIFNGYTYDVSDCSTDNTTACSVTSDNSTKTVVNPVLSARINTKGKQTIAYGKVEVKAKLPRGDWLWPAIWMLPENETYGAWPLSGEIDILEARGNLADYGGQGVNYVRSSLNFGPMESLLTKIYGWWETKRGGYHEAFHTYTLEWDSKFIRMSVDSRLQAMVSIQMKKEKQSFWNRGDYPQTAQNGSAEVVVENPWEDSGWSAPFDQQFYLIINVAVGGTSGWFPDSVGDKPWYDGSLTAMYDFAKAQDTWSATWPSSADDRAFRM